MKKAQSIRKTLENTFPDFKKNPENLAVMLTSRKTIPYAEGLNYKIEYELNIYVFNQNIDFSAFEAVIIKWARENSPDMLSTEDSRDDFLTANIEMLDYKNYNAELTLKITERILVTKTETGALNGEYAPEIKFDDPFIGDENVKNIDEPSLPTFTDLDVVFDND